MNAHAETEKARKIKRLEDYFELVEYSTAAEGANPNEEWDTGFQAAIALIKNEGTQTNE